MLGSLVFLHISPVAVQVGPCLTSNVKTFCSLQIWQEHMTHDIIEQVPNYERSYSFFFFLDIRMLYA